MTKLQKNGLIKRKQCQNHDVLMAIFCGKSKKEWINTIINLENNSKKISGFEF